MLHLFIDTNIYLNFYSFSSDHLSKLEELIKLSQKNKVKLYVTRQIVDEFYRKREVKLKESFKHIKEHKIHDISFPLICRDTSELPKIERSLKKIKGWHKNLQNNLRKKIKNNTLNADKLIERIFESSEIIEVPEHIFKQAERRYKLGNPPGKRRDPYGDAINWEILLWKVPKRRKLYFISVDNDFSSDINNEEFSEFLLREWKGKKGTNLVYYKSISNFLKDNFKQIKISKKDLAEEALVSKMQSIHDASKVRSELEETIKNIIGNSPVSQAMEAVEKNREIINGAMRVSSGSTAYISEAMRAYKDTIDKIYGRRK